MRELNYRTIVLIISFLLLQLITFCYKEALVYKLIHMFSVEQNKTFFLITNPLSFLLAEFNLCFAFSLSGFFLFFTSQILLFLLPSLKKSEIFFIKTKLFFNFIFILFYFFLYLFFFFPNIYNFLKNYIKTYKTSFIELNFEINFIDYQSLFLSQLFLSIFFLQLFLLFILFLKKIIKNYQRKFVLLIFIIIVVFTEENVFHFYLLANCFFFELLYANNFLIKVFKNLRT